MGRQIWTQEAWFISHALEVTGDGDKEFKQSRGSRMVLYIEPRATLSLLPSHQDIDDEK